MKNRNTNRWSLATALLAVTVISVGVATAEDRGGSPPKEGDRKPPSAAEFIKRLDTDADGQVSKSEFDGPAEHFTAIDKNSDGYISEDEAPTGPPPRGEADGRGGKRDKRR